MQEKEKEKEKEEEVEEEEEREEGNSGLLGRYFKLHKTWE